MRFNTLPNDPIIRKFSRQVAAYEAAGLDPDMEAKVPFAANYEYIFNNPTLTAHQVFSEMGIDGLGVARQLDQVEVENLGNNFAQKVKSAVAKGLPLPDQAVVSAMLENYDFTGVPSVSEEGMSTEERTILAEIRKAVRSLISSGTFSMLDANGAKTKDKSAVVFNAVRVQTGPEAKGAKATPPNSVPLDSYEAVVTAAYNGTEAELQDGAGNSATLDFSTPPLINEHGQARNISGVIELARQEGIRIAARNRSKAAAPISVAEEISL